MKWLLLLSLYFFSNTTFATHYYLSEKGNDANNGKTKTTPWRSLTRLSQQMSLLLPGDSVFLERNSRFEGTIELKASGIFIGAYGEGSKPSISGSQTITQWAYFGRNIWTAEYEHEPGDVFINGKPQPLGRYPNNGYLTISGSNESSTSLSDTTLNFPNEYWNRAELVTRSSRWTLDRLLVTDFKYNTFSLRQSASYPLQNGFGYFIQKHLATLDRSGEWYYDSTTKLLYLFLDAGENPKSYRVEASLADVGLIATKVKNVTLSNLTFYNNRIAGIRMENSTGITLLDVDVYNSGKNGLELSGCERVSVRDCSINNSNNNGVRWHNISRGTFTRNSICHTGLQAGRGESGNGNYIALSITSDKAQSGTNVFQYNTIDSSGYSAIDFRTGNTQIKDNLISNFCLVKDDGGGIYTWQNVNEGNAIESNIIFNGIGEGSGTHSPYQRFAHGIYIDDRTKDIAISGNRIYQCATSGIFLHNAKAITLAKNVVYDNGYSVSNVERGQLYIRLDTLGQFGKDRMLKLNVSNNYWIAENDISYCVYISVEKENDLSQLGTLAENEFRSQTQQQCIGISVQQSQYCSSQRFSLKDWKLNKQYENGSTFKRSIVESQATLLENNLITNGTLTKDIDGWMIWPEKSSLHQETIGILDGPSLSVVIPVNNKEALIYHEGFSVSEGKLYRLSFSAIAANANAIEFVPMMAASPWEALGAYTCFTIDSNPKTFTYFFVAEQSADHARVNFKSQANFWIDNVSLYEVPSREL